jgi:hypothetical protein
MGVFSKFNPGGVGRASVVKSAHPSVEPIPWLPLNTTTRQDTQWGGAGKVHRVGPHERGITFQKSALGSWQNNQASPLAAAPAMSSGCGGACGGCGGCQGMPLGKGTNRQR